jgi:hypothetical protein
MANPLTVITSLAGGKSPLSNEVKGIVKRDWVPTGRIDFATKIDSNDDPNRPSEFKLLVEERRIIESVAGNEHLEIQWRLATLKEAKLVAAQYLKYLTENSLIKPVSDPEILPPELSGPCLGLPRTGAASHNAKDRAGRAHPEIGS